MPIIRASAEDSDILKFGSQQLRRRTRGAAISLANHYDGLFAPGQVRHPISQSCQRRIDGAG